MFSALLDGVRSERAVGVPRRFSIGTLFILLTLYALLFRALVLLGADQVWTALICLFFAAVTTGQMILFGGAYPRAASLLSGGIACPLMLVGLLADEASMQWSGWEPSNIGNYGPLAYLSVFLLLALLGVCFGYVVGGATAGVFYVIAKCFPKSSIAGFETSRDGTTTPRFTEALLKYGGWLSPVQPNRPLCGAFAIFVLFAAFGVFLSPFITWLSAWHVIGTAVAIGTFLAVLSGNLQLWFYWPFSFMLIGIAAGAWHLEVVRHTAICRTHFSPSVLGDMIRITSGLAAIAFSAIVGWSQWCLLRREARGFGWRAFVAACIVLVGLNYLVANRLKAWAQSPTQILFSKVFAGGGTVYFSGPWSAVTQRIHGAHLMENCSDEDFLQLLPAMQDSPYGVQLSGEGFTDRSVRAIDGLHLELLWLGSTSITDAAFEGIGDLSATSVMFNDDRIGDATLRRLASLPSMARVVQSLTLDRTLVTDDGLAPLSAFAKLSYLSLNGCKITDAGLEQLSAVPLLRDLSLQQCPITDEALEVLAKLPRLRSLRLDHTSITDDGLAFLLQSKSLQQVTLEGTRVTRSGVESLKPRLSVRWRDPNDED